MINPKKKFNNIRHGYEFVSSVYNNQSWNTLYINRHFKQSIYFFGEWDQADKAQTPDEMIDRLKVSDFNSIKRALDYSKNITLGLFTDDKEIYTLIIKGLFIKDIDEARETLTILFERHKNKPCVCL